MTDSCYKIGFADIDGVLRGKYIHPQKFESAISTGMGFCDVVFGWDIQDQLYDKSSVTGWERGYPDIPGILDKNSERDIPWEPRPTKFFMLDFMDPVTKEPWDVSPRGLLKKIAQKSKNMGFDPIFSSEFEFFIFSEDSHSMANKSKDELKNLTPGMYGYSYLRASENRDFIHDLVENLQGFGIEVEGIHTETGPGVFEAAMRHNDILKAADDAFLFKTAVKEIAMDHGLKVTFMAKWNEKYPGSGGHFHQSLLKDGKNVFYSEDGGISQTARNYVAGLMKLARPWAILSAPNINSFKRLVPGAWAPVNVTWGEENRTASIRLIGKGSPKACHFEYRMSGADVNPYIVMAANLAAGLAGIENSWEPPAPFVGNAYEAKDTEVLPANLMEGCKVFEEAKDTWKYLSEDFCAHYLVSRDWECREFLKAITDWEINRYMEII